MSDTKVNQWLRRGSTAVLAGASAPSPPTPVGTDAPHGYFAYDTDKLGMEAYTGAAWDYIGGQQGAQAWKTDISPAQITANQNDYNPASLSTAAVMRINSDAARSITGLAGGADGRLMTVHNVGGFSITLEDEDAGSAAANRFAFDGDMVLTPDSSCFMRYDATSSRWRLVGVGKVSGGGGSTTFIGLTDVPATFTGQAGKNLRVNTAETALEFFYDQLDRVGQLDVVNTAAETDIYSFSIPANLLGTDRFVDLILFGDWLNNSGAGRTITLAVKLGATTIWKSTTGSIAASANRATWAWRVSLGNVGAANSQVATSEFNLGNTTAATNGVGSMTAVNTVVYTTGGGTAAEDTTAAKTLTLTITHSTNNANLSFRRNYAALKFN